MAEISETVSAGGDFSAFLRLPDEDENGFVIRWSGLVGTTILSVEWKRPGEPDAEAVRGHQITAALDGSEGMRWGRISGAWDIRAGARSGEFDSQAFTVDLFSNAPSGSR